MKNPWKTLSSEQKYDNNWINVREDKVITPSNTNGIYGVVTFKNKAIGVIPLDENLNIWLVGQHRYPLNEYSWEIPEGGCPIGEEPLETAKRELLEETGISAKKWTKLGRIHTSNSVCNEEGFYFLAQELSHGQSAPEETEDLKIRKVSLNEAVEMVIKGEITDSISTTALLMLDKLIQLKRI